MSQPLWSMSSSAPPEFFVDRSLGKRSVEALQDAGYLVHHLSEVYPNDAQDIADVAWIADGCARGWCFLTKDKKIRYRAHELSALEGRMFCLANGNLKREEAIQRFLDAMPAILRAINAHPVGFWRVYERGRIERGW